MADSLKEKNVPVGSREMAWQGAWERVESLSKLYRSYGVRNALWCLDELTHNERKERVLDLGCGSGFYFKFFADHEAKELHGLECDQKNIIKAQQLNAGIPVKLIKADVRDLPGPYPNGHFDIVISLGLVEHFKNPISIVRKMLSLVKPGGVLILEIPNCRNWIYYSYILKNKSKIPFMLGWGVKEWKRVLSRVKGGSLEGVATGDFWSEIPYFPLVVSKISTQMLDMEIALENKLLFRGCGSQAFYKIRKD